MNFIQYPLFLLIVAWLALASDKVSADLPAMIDKVRPAIVAVGTVHPTRNPRSVFTGTGFVVGGGRHVVTNMHVIPDDIDFVKKETVAVFSGRGKTPRSIPQSWWRGMTIMTWRCWRSRASRCRR